MSTAVAAQMMGADFLKLRKKRGTLIWALVLAFAPIVIYFIVTRDPARLRSDQPRSCRWS